MSKNVMHTKLGKHVIGDAQYTSHTVIIHHVCIVAYCVTLERRAQVNTCTPR